MISPRLLLGTSVCILLAAPWAASQHLTDWDRLQTTSFRPAADWYAPPLPIVHPASAAVCHTILTNHEEEERRLTREHQECLDGFHAPPRTSRMREEDCSLHLCQPLHNQQLDAKRGHALAVQYETDCLKSYEKDHPAKPKGSPLPTSETRPVQKTTSFRDDPKDLSSPRQGSIEEQLAQQHQKNMDALKPSPSYKPSYAPSGEYGKADYDANKTESTWGWCEASVFPPHAVDYDSRAFQFSVERSEELKAQFQELITKQYKPTTLMTACIAGFPSESAVENAIAAEPSRGDGIPVVRVAWP